MSVSGSNTTISSLMSSTTYFIQVAAVNSAGTGVYSDAIDAKTDGKLIIDIIIKINMQCEHACYITLNGSYHCRFMVWIFLTVDSGTTLAHMTGLYI